MNIDCIISLYATISEKQNAEGCKAWKIRSGENEHRPVQTFKHQIICTSILKTKAFIDSIEVHDPPKLGEKDANSSLGYIANETMLPLRFRRLYQGGPVFN